MESSSLPEGVFGRARRKSPVARFIEALHLSRRLKAQQVLCDYRHLIAEERQGLRRSAASNPGKAEQAGENADRDINSARMRSATLQGASY